MNELNCTYYSDSNYVNNNNLELLFIYVDNYKHFKNFSFGVNAKYTFEYENNRLIIKDNLKYVRLFPDNINLKILCGKNGVGKTSIMRLLYNIDCHPDCFVVFQNQNGQYYTNKKDLEIIYNNERPFYCNKECSVLRSFHYSLHNDGNILDFKLPYLQERFCKKYVDNIELFTKLSQKTFSKDLNIPTFNYFDLRFSKEEDAINDFTDDIKRLFGKELQEEQVMKYVYKNPVKFEILYQICSWSACNIGNTKPKPEQKSEEEPENYLDQLLEKITKKTQLPLIDKINRELKNIVLNSIDKDFINSFKKLIYSCINYYKEEEICCNVEDLVCHLYQFCKDENIYENHSIYHYDFLCSFPDSVKIKPFTDILLKNHYSSESIRDFFDFVLRHTNCIKNKNDKLFESLLYAQENKFCFNKYPLEDLELLYNKIEDLTSELKPIETYINQFIQEHLPGSDPNIEFDLNSLFYRNVFVSTSSGNIYFSNLSTGQQLMLMNLINIRTTTISACEKPKTLIFNDDVDAYLHPDWCREYLSIYIESIKKYLEVYPKYSKRKYNIIIATHSPIILSDVTNEYVAYLELDNNGHPKEVHPKANSFAGNIGQMYNDNFFMDHLIGDHSNHILEEVIHYIKKDKDYLNSLEFIHDDNDCEKYINAVGDKLLKNLLTDEYQIMKESRQYEEN